MTPKEGPYVRIRWTDHPAEFLDVVSIGVQRTDPVVIMSYLREHLWACVTTRDGMEMWINTRYIMEMWVVRP